MHDPGDIQRVCEELERLRQLLDADATATPPAVAPRSRRDVLQAARQRAERTRPLSIQVGVCDQCVGPVLFSPGDRSAACGCGHTVIPPAFFDPPAGLAGGVQR